MADTLTPTPVLPGSDADPLYERVAAHVAGLIDAGTLRPGDRVPSVRGLHGQLGVSIATVIHAYRLLEDRKRLEARPQSGYYVRLGAAAPAARAPEPRTTRPPDRPRDVSIAERVVRMVKDIADPRLVPFGGAVPSDACLPTRKLNRLAAAIARRRKDGANGYDPPPGARELRVQVARRYLDAGCALSPDDVITTCGCQEALSLCLRAVAQPGDVIAIESPTFYGHLQTIHAHGMRALEIPTNPRTGVCQDGLEAALARERVKACLFVTNCQNPLGGVMPDDRKRWLVDLLAARDIPLIEDDIYGDLAFGPQRPRVCKALDGGRGLVLLCSSFSKTLAPGMRVGWCAPGPRYHAAVEQLKLFTTLATPTLPQLAIAGFLATGGYDHHLRSLRKFYERQVAVMSDAIARYFPDGTGLTRPAGGHVLWVELPEGTSSLRLLDRAIEHGISIAPGPVFSAAGRYENFVRLNCACPWDERCEEAVRTLGRLVSEQLAAG